MNSAYHHLIRNRYRDRVVSRPTEQIGTSIDFLGKEARDKLGITWKSYDTFRRAVTAHSIAAIHSMWVYRCKTLADMDSPPPG